MQDGEVGIIQMMAELVDEAHQLGGENRLQTIRELLRISNAAMEGLMRLGAVRTRNAPIEGVAELIACECLDLTLAARNQQGFDATDAEGLRYQIKGICTDNNTGRTSPIREPHDFEYVVVVVCARDYVVRSILNIPRDVLVGTPELWAWSNRIQAHQVTWKGNRAAINGVQEMLPLFHQRFPFWDAA